MLTRKIQSDVEHMFTVKKRVLSITKINVVLIDSELFLLFTQFSRNLKKILSILYLIQCFSYDSLPHKSDGDSTTRKILLL